MEGSSVNNLHVKTERKLRLIVMDIQFKKEPSDTVVVQFDFQTKKLKEQVGSVRFCNKGHGEREPRGYVGSRH